MSFRDCVKRKVAACVSAAGGNMSKMIECNSNVNSWKETCEEEIYLSNHSWQNDANKCMDLLKTCGANWDNYTPGSNSETAQCAESYMTNNCFCQKKNKKYNRVDGNGCCTVTSQCTKYNKEPYQVSKAPEIFTCDKHNWCSDGS